MEVIIHRRGRRVLNEFNTSDNYVGLDNNATIDFKTTPQFIVLEGRMA